MRIGRRMDTLCGVLEFADPVELCSSGEDILIVVFTDSFFFFLNKLSLKDTVSYCFTLFLQVADPATFLASVSVLGIFILARLFTYVKKKKVNASSK